MLKSLAWFRGIKFFDGKTGSHTLQVKTHTHTHLVYSLIKTQLYVFSREIWVVLDVNNLALEQVMVVVSGILCFWQAILIVPGKKKSSSYNWFTEAIAGFCLREGSVCVSCVLSSSCPNHLISCCEFHKSRRQTTLLIILITDY